MKHYDIHPDFWKYRFVKPPMNAFLLPIVNFFLPKVLNHMPLPRGLTKTRRTMEGYRGAPLGLYILEPAGAASPVPALVYFHGGGFAMQEAPHHTRLVMDYALQTPCKVFFVNYRLLPGNPFPAGLEDCYSAYRWVRGQAASLGVDPERIAVGGDSAGGTLAAGVCLMARDRGVPLPCFQMLIYPATDARQATPSMREFSDTPLWNSRLNAKMWRMYLKNGIPPTEKREYASPAEADSLRGLPPTYLEVAEFDCLRDEGIAFANALRDSGVATELNKTRRTIHGFEVARNNEIVLASIARRVQALLAAFYGNERR